MTPHRIALWGTVGGVAAGAGYATGDLLGAIVGAVVTALLGWLTEREGPAREEPLPEPGSPEEFDRQRRAREKAPPGYGSYREPSSPPPGKRKGKVGLRARWWAARKSKGQ